MMSHESWASRSSADPSTPQDLLAEIRNHPEWDDKRRAEQFDRLIAGFPADLLGLAIRPRLGDLGQGDGEILLQLVEGLADQHLFDALADALIGQPNLHPERLWMALSVLEGTGCVEARPILVESLEELDDLIGGDDSLSELAAELEDDPDSMAIALEGLARIEPDVRIDIIAGLAIETAGPGVLLLLKALAESADPGTRLAALEALSKLESRAERISAEPILPEGSIPDERTSGQEVELPGTWPRIVRSAVGPLDAEGRGRIVLLSQEREGWVVADVACDVVTGLGPIRSGFFRDRVQAGHFYADFSDSDQADIVRDQHVVALALLGGASWLSSQSMSVDAKEFLIRATGPNFRPAPIFTQPRPENREGIVHSDPSEDARRVLNARPAWRDDSELARGLAVEIALREGNILPDPARDPGPFRVFFENRILDRIELYRRMLCWTALCWEAQGNENLARSAMRIAVQLADPQHAVPGHPFLSILMSRSLTLDPRMARRGLES